MPARGADAGGGAGAGARRAPATSRAPCAARSTATSSPARLMAALRARARATRPCRVVYGAEVTGWRVDGGAWPRSTTTAGEFAADEFVLAAGVWSAPVARDLGLRAAHAGGQGLQPHAPATPPHLPRHCALLSRGARGGHADGRRAARRRHAGADAASTPRVDPAPRARDPEGACRSTCPTSRPRDFERLPAWCGLRPCSPDGLPYLGRSRRLAQPRRRHRPRDDGREPRARHRPAASLRCCPASRRRSTSRPSDPDRYAR